MKYFLNDVLTGLSSPEKYLNSKYFYDKRGDEIFQEIMNCEEYYLTNAEMEIFTKQSNLIADAVLKNLSKIDIIELGPGDVSKSKFLLEELLKRNALGTYFPIDISDHIIHLLDQILPESFPDIKINGLNGEYLEMLPEANKISNNRKLILILGGNIGNFKPKELEAFLKNLRSKLAHDDMVLIGFDIKKHPRKILAAYDDKEGHTKDFNLNLLTRINNELNANFEINNFEHFATYDPGTGACKSYLISLHDQEVKVGDKSFSFQKNEQIFMEVSQKYSLKEVDEMSTHYGFAPLAKFFDVNNYFLDAIWKCVDK